MLFGCNSQKNRLKESEIAYEDTIFTFEKSAKKARERLQITVDLYEKKKLISIEKEYFSLLDLLQTREDVESFAKNLILKRYPEIKNFPEKYDLSEDRTKKLWIYYTEVPCALDGGIYLVIVKNNCKVVYFNNFCCPR
jgi:hypothetical protein